VSAEFLFDILLIHANPRLAYVGFESVDLVNHVVKSAEDQPGALPLLALPGRICGRGNSPHRIG
jgi:hypothetical protein